MSSPSNHADRMDVVNYYASFGEREWQRLEKPSIGSVEFTITCHALDTHLPADGRILDLGAGPGRYAIWLAQRGYRVVLADLSPDMLALAEQKIEQAGVGDRVEAIVEVDACDLRLWEDGVFDAILSLGPFYHLPDEADRSRAAHEAYRVLRPGGCAFFALMPRMAFIRRTLYLADERHRLHDEVWLEALFEHGIFRNDVPGRFDCGYGVDPAEVTPYFESHGFKTEELLSLEGFTAGLEAVFAQMAEEEPDTYSKALQILLETASDPSILGMALHLLYIGRRSLSG